MTRTLAWPVLATLALCSVVQEAYPENQPTVPVDGGVQIPPDNDIIKPRSPSPSPTSGHDSDNPNEHHVRLQHTNERIATQIASPENMTQKAPSDTQHATNDTTKYILIKPVVLPLYNPRGPTHPASGDTVPDGEVRNNAKCHGYGCFGAFLTILGRVALLLFILIIVVGILGCCWVKCHARTHSQVKQDDSFAV